MLCVFLSMLDTPEQEEKFEHIYSSYSDYLYNVAFTFTHDKVLAEDAAQEALLQIVHEIDFLRTENEKQLKSYLYLIARNRAIDIIRKHEKGNVHVQLLEEITSEVSIEDVEELAITHLQLEKAIRILTEMPELYQRALYLSVSGYTIREIAHITKSSESAVKSRIHRARKTILAVFTTN